MDKVTFLIDEDILREVKEIAKVNKRSVGFIIRELVNKGLDKKIRGV